MKEAKFDPFSEARLRQYKLQQARLAARCRKCQLTMAMGPNRAVRRLYSFLERMEAEGRMTDEKYEKMEGWISRMEARIVQDDIEEFM